VTGRPVPAGHGVPGGAPAGPSSNIRSRVTSGAVFTPLIIAMVWFGVPATAALVSAAACVGVYEFHRMTVRAGATPTLLLGIVAGVLFVVEAVVDFNFQGALITGTIIVPLFLLLLTPPKERLLADWVWTLAGVFLIGWTLSHAVRIRALVEGREWLLTAVILTFAVDTSAYVIGRLVGRHPMAPTISPRKTWEGSIAGIATGMVAGWAVTAGFDLEINAGQGVLLGFLLAVASQFGDLSLSMIKRMAGVKDSSGLIPGHGGVLDRLDSLIPAIVVLYYFVTEGLSAP